MSGKQIFITLVILVIVLRHPEVIGEVINGILNLFQVTPHG